MKNLIKTAVMMATVFQSFALENCVTNIAVTINSGQGLFVTWQYTTGCPYSTNNYPPTMNVGGCSTSSGCGIFSSYGDSVIVFGPTAGATVGNVQFQLSNGQSVNTNLVLNSQCTGATFFWGITCTNGCTNCIPFVCRQGDNGCAGN